jgi:hypothetical protein
MNLFSLPRRVHFLWPRSFFSAIAGLLHNNEQFNNFPAQPVRTPASPSLATGPTSLTPMPLRTALGGRDLHEGADGPEAGGGDGECGGYKMGCWLFLWV